MSWFKAKLTPIPKEVEMQIDNDINKYVPQKYQVQMTAEEQAQQDVVEHAAEILNNHRAQVIALQRALEAREIDNKVLEQRNGDLKVEVEQLKTDLMQSNALCAEALKELHEARGVFMVLRNAIDSWEHGQVTPLPKKAKRKKNGEDAPPPEPVTPSHTPPLDYTSEHKPPPEPVIPPSTKEENDVSKSI